MNALRRPRTQGFTLIELLASTALFAVLGAMLFQLVTGAMDLWTRGERIREVEERASAVLDLMAEDLRHSWSGWVGAGEQDARFLLDWRTEGGASAAQPGRHSVVLRFSRLLYEARSLAWLRHAGETPAAEGAASLAREEDPRTLRPTGGLAESLYASVWLAGDDLPILVRRVRTPLGGHGSLLEPDLIQQQDRLLTDALLLAERVLYFGVQAWAPSTVAWDLPGESNGERALTHWDSTRGQYAPGDPAFPFGKGPSSLDRDQDDMVPGAVLLELVIDPYEGNKRAPASLGEPLGEQASTLVLAGSGFGGDDSRPDHIWVDGEWMAVRDVSGRVVTVERGVRGTQAQAHEPGAPIRVGISYRRVVLLPGARQGLVR